ncbi:MAG: PfkB family carbohydrate kinase [Acidobacteriota bacterium]
MDVVGLGESSVDYINLLPHVPGAPGVPSKLRISSQFVAVGGQVATMLAACSALGLRARYLGTVGNDDNGRRIREELERRGVDLSSLIVHEATSRFAIILVDESTGERTVLWHRDGRLTLGETEAIEPSAFDARVLHVDGVDEEAAIRAARVASARGVRVTSDLDRVTDRTPELVAAVSVPIFAEDVPAALTGEADQERALRKLRKHHPGLLCVTLGPGGSMALDGDRLVHVPAFPVDAVDTTGAGDVFRAGFVYGMLAGWPTRDMLQFANAAAAISCTRVGALAGTPSLDEVNALLERRDPLPAPQEV